MTASADHDVVDRRRIALIEPGLPTAPVEHEIRSLGDDAAASFVAKVRASAFHATSVSLDQLAAALPGPIVSMSLRAPDRARRHNRRQLVMDRDEITAEVAARLVASQIPDLTSFATDLAAFLANLQAIDASAGPPPGGHSGLRGGPLTIWDEPARRMIHLLSRPRLTRCRAELAAGPAR